MNIKGLGLRPLPHLIKTVYRDPYYLFMECGPLDILGLLTQNLLSPAILFFALGLMAGLIKSDLAVPESISRYLSLYLMMAIGLKGGVAFANTDHFGPDLLWTLAAGVCFGFLQPVLGFFLLKITTKLDRATMAAVAAHYGSISIVTFATAVSFLELDAVVYAGYIVAIVALMEAPAIISGLVLAHNTEHAPGRWNHLARDVMTNGAVVLLMGTFIIGWIVGTPGLEKIGGFVIDPFQGLLCFFLLDMGLVVAKNLTSLRQFTPGLIAFGIYMPLIGGGVGLSLSKLIGLDVGTGMLFTVLCASASYIAVPAAMRLALPQANASIYVPMSLAITFPFNISLGIPLYYWAAKLWLG
jgi:uncharacterized protein